MKQLIVLAMLFFLSGCEILDVSFKAMEAMGEWKPSTHSSPGHPGSKQETAVNLNAPLIKAGGASRDKGGCSFEFVAEAGHTYTITECQARILPDFFGRRRRMSSFEFVAEAGHTYTITATDKECMSLLDITSEEIVIACEPYEKSE